MRGSDWLKDVLLYQYAHQLPAYNGEISRYRDDLVFNLYSYAFTNVQGPYS